MSGLRKNSSRRKGAGLKRKSIGSSGNSLIGRRKSRRSRSGSAMHRSMPIASKPPRWRSAQRSWQRRSRAQKARWLEIHAQLDTLAAG
jgi:hypothetical protein